MPSLSKGLSLSSSLKEEVMTKNRQGIVSILGSESDGGERTKATTASSLRRTLSADMSSTKWQAQHGFIPLKRIASSEELLHSSSSSSSCSSYYDQETRSGTLDFWGSVQNQDGGDHDDKKQPAAGQFDIWSAIVAQKAKEEELLPAPYVHPLVKRSASSLSGKSLEICTESLGSETGSDGYSSYPSSEANSDQEDEDEKEEEVRVEESKVDEGLEMEPLVAKYNNLAAASKRVRSRSFPPPIPSLGSCDGLRVHIKSHRDNGRVVLEAVSIPSQNNFKAERQDGRLVLSFIGTDTTVDGGKLIGEEVNEEEVDQFEVETGDESEEDVQEEGIEEVEDDKKVGFVMELDTPRLPSGVIMHKLAFMMKKPRVLANNMNPNWSNKFDDLMEVDKKEEEMAAERMSPVTRSLPPRPPMAHRMITTTKTTVVAAPTKAAGSLNAYEYYWKAKSAAPTRVASKVSGFSPVSKKSSSMFESDDNNNNHHHHQVLSKSYMANERQQMMLLRGNKGEYLVPMIKGCKDPRRSFTLGEPHCIATS